MIGITFTEYKGYKLNNIDYGPKLNVRNISLEYVKKFCYLGVYLDSEMTLSALVSPIKKLVSNKVSTLIKIRKYITTKLHYQFTNKQYCHCSHSIRALWEV